MLEVKEKPQMVERAFLVGVYQEKHEETFALSLLEELKDLVTSLGIGIIGQKTLRAKPLQAHFLIGSGKTEETIKTAKALKADCIIIDNELSPSQQRNWERAANITVIDRHEIILDIFGKRAMTKEAKLQVELARLEYFLPRLTRAWTHLGRQGGTGGTGARGEGEQQLEIDRRIIRRQIIGVRKELEHVKKVRATQRKERRRIPIPNAAIVGYTNAGKSSLLNRLTGANVLVEDKLFATLDTTTRRIELPNGHPLLLTDTVGFVRNLPHRLVDAFKATLEEAVLSNFLIHLLDANHPEMTSFFQTTLDVLKELGADQKRIITVFNKIDLSTEPAHIHALRLEYPNAVFISVKKGEGLSVLVEHMTAMVSKGMAHLDLCIPHSRADLIALLHERGKVIEQHYENNHVKIHALVPHRIRTNFQPYIS